MRKGIFFLFVVLASAVEVTRHNFDAFLHDYGKHYEGAEYEIRFKNFVDNMRRSEELQAGNPEAVYGVTKFSDLSRDEFVNSYLMKPMAGDDLAATCLRNGVYLPKPVPKDIPDSLDWRETDGVVTEVKDQGQCGSCWAFSTAANIEGVTGVAGTPSGSLSPQYLVDCSKGCSSEIINGRNTTVCNQGCNGGWPWTAFFDIINNGGIPGWDDYPYTGMTGTCKGNQGGKILQKISNYTCIGLDKTDNEDEIAQYLVDLGPLSIALNAEPFQTYRQGILDPLMCNAVQLNHAVLLVGYGTEGGKDFWIIKNSWGASWGEQGYVRLARGKGTCGVNEAVSCAGL